MSENVENKDSQNKLGELKEKAGDMLDQATEKAGELKEKAGDMLNQASDKAGEMWDKTEDKAAEVWTDVKEKAADLAEGAKGLWDKVVDKFDGDEETEKPAEKQ